MQQMPEYNHGEEFAARIKGVKKQSIPVRYHEGRWIGDIGSGRYG